MPMIWQAVIRPAERVNRLHCRLDRVPVPGELPLAKATTRMLWRSRPDAMIAPSGRER